MAIVSDVEIRLRADIARLQADMDSARRSVGGAMSSITSSVKIASAALAAFAGAAVLGAIVALVKGLKEMVTGAIDAAGSLNDLSIQTGASVAALMQFKAIGATSDTTVETLAAAMNKLAKGFSSTTEESKGLPQALKSIGLEFESIRKLAPEQQTLAIAKALDNFGDGTGKAAVAMAFYGKEGAKLLPFLKDLADEHDRVTAALTEQEIASKKALAAMADNFGDNLTKIQQSSAETRKSFAYGILPALYEASEAMLMLTKTGGGTKETIDKLSKDGSLADWARTTIDVLTYIPDVLQVLARVALATFTLIKTVAVQTGEALMGVGKAAMQFIEGDYKKSWETIGETTKAVRATATADAQSITDAFNAPTFGSKLREQLKMAREVKDAAAEAAKPQVDFRPPADSASTKEEEKRLKMYKDLLAVINEHIAATAREAAGLEPYNAAQREMIKLDEELASGKRKLLPAEDALLRTRVNEWGANLAAIDSQKALVKMHDELSKIAKKEADEHDRVIKGATDEAEKNEELARTYGMTKTAIEQMELARLKDQLARRSDTAMTLDEIEQLKEVIALKERSVAAVASVDELKAQEEFWKSIDKTAHDTFVSISDGGKNAWQRLKDSAKNIFFDWLYQMTIKKWLINISASMDGQGVASALAAASGGGSGLGGLASAGNSLSSLYSMATGGGMGAGFLGSLAGGLNGAGIGSGLTSSLGLSIGNSVASVLGPSISGALSTGLGAISTALPWVAGALAVYSIGKAAFGRGPAQVDSQGIRGTFADDTVYGQNYQNMLEKGGWLRSDKRYANTQGFDAGMQEQLGGGFKALKDAASAAGQSLGIAGDAVTSYRKTFEITLGKDAAANQKLIEDFFAGMGDEIATRLVPNLAQFAQKGESAAATLQRLAANAQGVDAVLAAFGSDSAQAFGATGGAAIEARERLVALAGGLSALGTQAQYFADNFLTGAEKVAPAQKQLADVLGQLGYVNIKTVDQYKDAVTGLVKSGALATESGAKTYAALLALAPAFKAVTDYTNELKNAANDVAGAALDALGKAVDAQKNVVTAAYEKAMSVLDARIDSLNDTISTTTALSRALRDSMTGVAAPGSGEASRAVAMAQIQTALAIAKASGALPTVDSLADALATLKGDSADQFGSLADYQRSVAQTNAALDALGGLSDTQLSAAEQQLAATIAQKDALTAANVAELARLDNLVLAAQAQINAVNGVNSTLITVGQALIGVYNAAQVLSGYTGISATSVAPMGSPSATIDTNALLAELQTLNTRIASMEEHAAQTAGSTSQFAKQFNDVSAGGNALLTETA